MPVNFPYLKRYSGVIAAAVCVAVILPAMALLRPQFKGYSAADTTEEIAESAAADAGAAENMAMPQEEDGSEAGSIKEAGLETDRETDENGDMPMDAGAGEKDEDAAAPLKSREAAAGSADDFSSQPAEAATEEKESSMSDQSMDNGKVSEMGEGTLIKQKMP